LIYSTSHSIRTLFALLFFCVGCATYAQTDEQKTLELKRERLQKEIADINRLLFAKKKEKGTVLDQMEALDKKIGVRQELIKVSDQESNLLNRKINANVRDISALRTDLTSLKEKYATIIQKSYQNRTQQNRLMFLLSSENFFQAFKRLQYMKQYTDYRREQGEQIQAKTEELTQLNTDLVDQRKKKDALIVQSKKAKAQLMREMKNQKELLGTIRQNESQYAAQVQQKKKEAKKIDRQIEEVIRKAILASNKEAGKETESKSKFVLTPEATIIANNFSANKGRLIWPVEKGIKSQGFGIYNDAVYPGIKHESNGVIIATDEGVKARSIFKGEVIAILSVPGGNKGVQIKHGNYISTYYNLSELYVTKGDKVDAKAELGMIYTNQANGQTRLKFYLYEDTNKLNPEEWLYLL